MSRRLSVIGLVLLDGAIAFLSLILAWKARYSVWGESIRTPYGHFSQQFFPYVPVLLLVPFVRVASTWWSGGFRLRGGYSRSEDLWGIMRAGVRGSLVIVLLAGLIRREEWLRIAEWDYHGKPADIFPSIERHLSTFEFSRPVFLYDFAFYLALAILFRAIIRHVQIRMRRRGRNLIPVILVGNGEESQDLISAIEKDPRMGRKVVSRIDGGEPGEIRSHLRELIPRYHAEEIIFSGSKLSHPQIFQLVMECEMETPIDVKLLPDITDLVTRKLELSRLGGMPVLTLMGDPIGPANRLAKRMMDVVIGSVGAVLVAIPSLIAALLIKLDSRGPVLFVQKRVGQDGRVFNCYKFRTMISGAGPERHKRFMEKVIARANSPEADGSGEKELYKEKDDPRITQMGRFLRRYSLDEVPQIINVLRGEMSLVGPRPPIPYEVREYEDWHRGRLATRPGITGLWQVSGRNEISFEGMVRLDIFYIENYSLWLDLKILLQTIPAVLRGTGY